MDKTFLIIALCFLWTMARVAKHWEWDLMTCNWSMSREDGPWLLFYPIFAIVQVIRYGIFPIICSIILYILFM